MIPAPAAPFDVEMAYGRPVDVHGLTGLLHPAKGLVGAVLAPAWGYEGLCLHPLARRIAGDLAAAGVSCLRIDPPGCGHSPDLPEGDLASAWRDGARAGVAALRAQTGVEAVLLVGVGLGASAVAAAAAGTDGLAGVCLIAPWISGRRALRELAASARVADEALGVAADPALEPGGLSVAGFTLSKTERDSLSRVEIAPNQLADCPSTLIVARPELMTSAQTLLDALPAGTAAIAPFEDYDKAAFDPSSFVMPEAVVATVLDWARARVGAASARPARGDETPIPDFSAPPDTPWRESALRFGPQDRLFGVLCEPAEGRPRAAVLLLNAGRNRCVGWARGDVAEARRLAAAGVVTFRFDMAGVGDSAPAGAREPLYDDARAADVSAAIDLIESRFGASPIALRGQCSGAYLGFRAAVADARVGAAALINAQRYVWNARDDFDTVMRQPVHHVQIAREARDPRQILRLLKGEIALWPLARRLTRRLAREVQARLGRKGLAFSHDAGLVAQGRADFDALARRGIALNVIISEGDRAIEELRLYFGEDQAFRAQHGEGALVTVAQADHNLTAPAARARASAALDALIARIARPA